MMPNEDLYRQITEREQETKELETRESLSKVLSGSAYGLFNINVLKTLGIHRALLLQELCRRHDAVDKGGKTELQPDGAFYATVNDIKEYTTISDDQQYIMFRQLQDAGFLRIELRTVPPRTIALRYFILNRKMIKKCAEGELLGTQFPWARKRGAGGKKTKESAEKTGNQELVLPEPSWSLQEQTQPLSDSAKNSQEKPANAEITGNCKDAPSPSVENSTNLAGTIAKTVHPGNFSEKNAPEKSPPSQQGYHLLNDAGYHLLNDAYNNNYNNSNNCTSYIVSKDTMSFSTPAPQGVPVPPPGAAVFGDTPSSSIVSNVIVKNKKEKYARARGGEGPRTILDETMQKGKQRKLVTGGGGTRKEQKQKVNAFITRCEKQVAAAEFADEVVQQLHKFIRMLAEENCLLPYAAVDSQLTELQSLSSRRQAEAVADTIQHGWKSLKYSIDAIKHPSPRTSSRQGPASWLQKPKFNESKKELKLAKETF